jgi:single-stranded-DNA-specific exonuclease
VNFQVAQEKRWSVKPVPSAAVVEGLAVAINIRPELASLLVQRGITDFEEAKKFFRPSLADLHDPFLMKDMYKAVDRLIKAVSEKEHIMVFGDYDVDGTTSVSLVYSFLHEFHEQVVYYIPDRYKEGYGLSFDGIDFAHDNGITLMITLDCGIKAVEKVKYAKEKGIDVIICDHHRPGKELPPAVAVLDPKQDECSYPYKELCGCGVGFKFMQAYCIKSGRNQDEILKYVDMLAVAIGADIVPVTGENRILMYMGLQKINESPCEGLKALLGVAGVKKELNVTDLVFILAPRINAAGRISHGSNAVALLTSPNPEQLEVLAKEIDSFNRERKDLDKQITQEALHILQTDPSYTDMQSTVVFKEDWHKGVVGIVASRLIEHVYRPTIVLTESNGMATGSARSIAHFDVYEAIDACNDLLVNFGGHTHAAGMTLKVEDVPEFRRRFEASVRERMQEEWLIPELQADLEISLAHLDSKFLGILKQMGPYGPGNMNPVFYSQRCKEKGWAKVVGEDHLKLQIIAEGMNHPIDAIAFKQAHHLDTVRAGKPFSILYTIEENEWQGMVKLQLNIKDIKAEKNSWE